MLPVINTSLYSTTTITIYISTIKGPRWPYYYPACFFFLFEKKCLLRSSHTISSIIVAWATRLTENGIPPEPNLCWCKVNTSDQRLHSPQSYLTTSNRSKHALLCLHPVKLFLNFGHSAGSNPKNYLAAFVLYGTQGSVRGLSRWECKWCHCRQSWMLNNIGGARTRTFFKLTSGWRSDIFSVLFWGFFRVEERIELIWHLYEKIRVNVSFNLR